MSSEDDMHARADMGLRAEAYADAPRGAIDGALERAVSAIRRSGDIALLADLLANRAGLRPSYVSDVLAGDVDEPCALLARAAGLPWDAFEAILSYRARRLGRGPGAFGATIKLFRDADPERARAVLARAGA